MAANKVLNSEDLFDILSRIWVERKHIVMVTTIFGLIGLMWGLTTPNEYQSSVAIIQHEQAAPAKLSGSFGALAGIAGINLGSTGETEISPQMYFKILRSYEFLDTLSNTTFRTVNDRVTVADYFKNHQKTALISKLLSLPFKVKSFIVSKFKDSKSLSTAVYEEEIIILSEEEYELYESLKERISVEVDEIAGVISIQVKMQDPRLAADIVLFSYKYLSDYITKHKSKKKISDMKFIENRYEEAKKRFEHDQLQLALFKESNLSVVGSKYRVKEQQLESQYNLSYELFLELSKQLEQANIRVQENKPSFTVLNQPAVPNDKTEPSRLLILVAFTFAGFFMIIGWKMVTLFLLEKEKF